jgi:hypothetical protein
MYEDQINRALGVFEHKNNVREHYYCMKELFDLYPSKDQLTMLSKRPDLDTLCAFDYQKMKQFALTGHGLHFKDYHPETQGITIPKLD